MELKRKSMSLWHKPFTISFFLLMLLPFLQAQKSKKIQLLHADITSAHPDHYEGEPVFTGNVQFKHEQTIMSCDTAVYYQQNNSVWAWGNVRIKGRRYTVTSKQMRYFGDTRKVEMQGDVVLKDKESTLKTDKMYFDRNTQTAYYQEGATIYNKDNVLFSEKGTYNVETKLADFSTRLTINNPQHTIKSEKATYNTQTTRTDFFGATHIEKKSNPSEFISTERGVYYTDSKQSYLYENSSVHFDKKILTAERLEYNQNTGFGRGFQKVKIDDSEEKRWITGDYGEIHQKKDSAFVTGKALAVRVFDKDSLYFHADTLFSVKKGEKNQVLRAYRNAKFYKSDIQGKADSIVYQEQKGLLTAYKKPVIWADNKQLTGDTLRLYQDVKTGQTDSVDMRPNAFFVSVADGPSSHENQKILHKSHSAALGKTKTQPDSTLLSNNFISKSFDSSNVKADQKGKNTETEDKKAKAQDALLSGEWDQIKGKKIVARLKEGAIYKVEVMGNAESLIYVNQEDKQKKTKKRIGLDLSSCGRMQADIVQKKVEGISCFIKTVSDTYPMHMVTDAMRKLEGFNWLDGIRIRKMEDIFLKDKIQPQAPTNENQEKGEKEPVKKLKRIKKKKKK